MEEKYRSVQNEFQGLVLREAEPDSEDDIAKNSLNHEITNVEMSRSRSFESICHPVAIVCRADFRPLEGQKLGNCSSAMERCNIASSILSPNVESFELLDMSSALDASEGETIFLVRGTNLTETIPNSTHNKVLLAQYAHLMSSNKIDGRGYHHVSGLIT